MLLPLLIAVRELSKAYTDAVCPFDVHVTVTDAPARIS